MRYRTAPSRAGVGARTPATPLLTPHRPMHPTLRPSPPPLHCCLQDIYQQTHPVLFSRRTIYLLVINQRTGMGHLESQLLNVSIRCPDAHFLIVGTHADLVHASVSLKGLQEQERFAGIKVPVPSHVGARCAHTRVCVRVFVGMCACLCACLRACLCACVPVCACVCVVIPSSVAPPDRSGILGTSC